MGTGGLYGAVAAGGFRRYATYRVATAAGVFTNTVFGLILAYTYHRAVGRAARTSAATTRRRR